MLDSIECIREKETCSKKWAENFMPECQYMMCCVSCDVLQAVPYHIVRINDINIMTRGIRAVPLALFFHPSPGEIPRPCSADLPTWTVNAEKQ
jgi:hypothetical protein